jgi:endoglucanase
MRWFWVNSFLAASVVFAGVPGSAELRLVGQAAVPTLGKGLNTDIWVEWYEPEEMLAYPNFLSIYPDWPRHVAPDRLTSLNTEGIDFIRMPVDPAPMLLGSIEVRRHLIGQIQARVEDIQAAGMTVIVDLHSIPREGAAGIDMIISDDKAWKDYLALVSEVGMALNGFDPARTLFEPINEPVNDCDVIWLERPGEWNKQVLELHQTARAAAPSLAIVLPGACWGGVDGLINLDPTAFYDDNIIFSFHSYEPFAFTHQQAGWTESDLAYIAGLPYPPSKLDEATAAELINAAEGRARASTDGFARNVTRESLNAVIAEYRNQPDDVTSHDINRALKWAEEHGLPPSRLLLGEFGVTGGDGTSAVRPEDRLAYLEDKRRAAEASRIPWAVWSWTGPLAVAENTPERPFLPGLCQALGLSCAP